ncbi:hypothetical protein ID875_21165 [Streptomyces globisporus]|uniref:Uncharacterized protein n=1 Tax=Streptomyces globisporus TaxID=1908 RepID=A0A927BNJ8_STRGL|nr:hypothetical protein [Streptomyces globisporus]
MVYRQRGDVRTESLGGHFMINGGMTVLAAATVKAMLWLIYKRPDEAESDAMPDVAPLLLWSGIGAGALALAGWGGLRLLRGRRAKRRRQQALERAHERVATSYAEYLTDMLEWLERPGLADVSVPETAALVQALAAADDARLGDDVDRYQTAVASLRTAWQAADDRARRTGLRALPDTERRAAEQARKLLILALDEGGSESERRAAYGKARSLLDGILVIPPQAVAALEADRRLPLPPKPF